MRTLSITFAYKLFPTPNQQPEKVRPPPHLTPHLHFQQEDKTAAQRASQNKVRKWVAMPASGTQSFA